jgi:hypothetical protein
MLRRLLEGVSSSKTVRAMLIRIGPALLGSFVIPSRSSSGRSDLASRTRGAGFCSSTSLQFIRSRTSIRSGNQRTSL